MNSILTVSLSSFEFGDGQAFENTADTPILARLAAGGTTQRLKMPSSRGDGPMLRRIDFIKPMTSNRKEVTEGIMKKGVVLIAFLGLGRLAFPQGAQDDLVSAGYANRLYIFAMYSSVGGVPLSYADPTYSYFGDFSTVKTSSSAPAFGIGYTAAFGSDGRFHFDFEFDFMTVKFNDWRVKDQRLSYYMFVINFGYALAVRPPFIGFIGIGGGVVHQHGQGQLTIDQLAYRNLDDNEYPMFLGGGLKISPVRHVVVRGEIKFYWAVYGGSTTTGVIYLNPEPISSEVIGTRLAAGLEFRF
jgi:hypothetical protein